MPLLVVTVLICVVHLATGIAAWTDVGLLADDREMIGAAILRHRGDWTVASMFLPDIAPDATRALYRPFIDLLFWLEYPRFGVGACGYHVVNSVMHCGTSVLWYALVRRWSGSLAAGLAAAVLFVGWPGHSEVTHWIAARTNVQSVFFLSLALWLHEVACTHGARLARAVLLVVAGLLACVAVGTKESAVFVVPLAALVSWLRSDTLKAAFVRTLPMVLFVFAWLWWRASRLGTWGTGSHYGWRLERVGYESCFDWLRVLAAPVHVDHLGFLWLCVLAVLHVAGLLVALSAVRHAGARRVLAVGGVLLGLGYVAGIGLEKLHVDVLQNVRYSYEPVLGLCAMLGVAVAALPSRARGVVLALAVAVHAWVLDGNRQSWLRVSAVYQQMHGEVLEQARTSQRAVRVFDAPGVYEGAFGYLNGFTEFLFWQQTAAPGVNLRGAVSSTQEWRKVLRELARAAQAKQPVDAFVVQWNDGALLPFTLDAQWPAQPFPGVQIQYARVARQNALQHSMLPVHVLLQTSQLIELRVAGDATVVVEASEQPQAVELWVPLHQDAQVAVELQVRLADGERRYALGAVAVVPR